MSELKNYVFELSPELSGEPLFRLQHGEGCTGHQIGVDAYNIEQAREFLEKALQHHGLEEFLPLVPKMEPQIYTDVHPEAQPGWL